MASSHTFTDYLSNSVTIRENDILKFQTPNNPVITGRITQLNNNNLTISWNHHYGQNTFDITEIFTQRNIENHRITKCNNIIPRDDGIDCSH